MIFFAIFLFEAGNCSIFCDFFEKEDIWIVNTAEYYYS